eukprot:GDKJ01027372.1.p1 GENE.GDKJ01027372.1~~GDKJ01027372.1.p1  ORF type:complete len:100 (+),score=5.77 GDKJ01027372.1:451-750(+)
MINYVKFNNEDGIVCFYLFVKDNEHILKPVIITLHDNKIKLYYYSIITGEKVNELSDAYFKLRLPFEKEVPQWDNLTTATITTGEWTEENFDNFFRSKE